MRTIDSTLTFLAAVSIAGAAYIILTGGFSPVGFICTKEQQFCEDGSLVSRGGPSCSFAPCSVVATHYDWQTDTSAVGEVTFQYPTPDWKYLAETAWPPTLTTVQGTLECDESAAGLGVPVEKEQVFVQGRKYCRTISSEGAAGSIYTRYTYSFQRGTTILSLAFEIRHPQCLNFDQPKSSQCQVELEAFNPDFLADSMASTVRFLNMPASTHY